MKKISITIANEESEVLEQLVVTRDCKWREDTSPTAIQLAARVRDMIEHRFEVEEDE